MSLHIDTTDTGKIEIGEIYFQTESGLSTEIAEIWREDDDGKKLLWQNGIWVTYHDNKFLTMTGTNGENSYFNEDTLPNPFAYAEFPGKVLPLFNSDPNVGSDVKRLAYVNDSLHIILHLSLYAFDECKSLASVSFPACQTIGEDAFYDCTSLTTVSFPVCQTIGSGAFKYCSSLSSANFLAVSKIGEGAFAYTNISWMSMLSQYFEHMDSQNNITKSGITLIEKSTQTLLWGAKSIVSYISNSNVTRIGSHAFYNCTSLQSASFPVCQTIGSYAFYECTSLQSASFPACQTIDFAAFYRCTSLTSVSFPACQTIGSGAFKYCSSLTSVSFPACQTIGSGAFYDCTSLTTVSFPVCQTIGESAFAGFFYNMKLQSLYLMSTAVVSLASTDAFDGSPLSQGGSGTIYVPTSLVTAYQAASNWSYLASRISGI